MMSSGVVTVNSAQTPRKKALTIADLRDHPLKRPAPGSGNHAIWILGHLTFIEGAMAHVILGEESPVAHYAPLFAPGTQPSDDASKYPSFDELLTSLRASRARNLRLLDEVGDAGLSRPPRHVPPGFEDAMRTNADVFMLLALHQMVHYGQLTDCRRAAGLKPLM